MTFAITLSKLKEFMIPEQLVGETAETPETLFFLKKDLKISQEIKRKMKIVVIFKRGFQEHVILVDTMLSYNSRLD